MDVPQPAPKEMPLLWKHADLPALEAFLKEEQLRGRFNPDPSLPFRGSSLIHLVKERSRIQIGSQKTDREITSFASSAGAFEHCIFPAG